MRNVILLVNEIKITSAMQTPWCKIHSSSSTLRHKYKLFWFYSHTLNSLRMYQTTNHCKLSKKKTKVFLENLCVLITTTCALVMGIFPKQSRHFSRLIHKAQSYFQQLWQAHYLTMAWILSKHIRWIMNTADHLWRPTCGHYVLCFIRIDLYHSTASNKTAKTASLRTLFPFSRWRTSPGPPAPPIPSGNGASIENIKRFKSLSIKIRNDTVTEYRQRT